MRLSHTLALSLFVAGAPLWRAEAQRIDCHLRRTSAAAYAGRCARNDTTVAMLLLRPPAGTTTGRWTGTGARIFGRGGDSSDVVDWTAFSPAMADVGAPGGVFASPIGWMAVTESRVDTGGLRFSAAPGTSPPATQEDLRILQVAGAYFTDSARWNRVDTRKSAVVDCPPAPAPRTLFCAFHEASVQVAGDFYGARPAGAALQAAIRAARPVRYQHPLTDFNNDPAVSFATIRRVYADAVERVEAQLRRPR